jgi:hypothetical protein
MATKGYGGRVSQVGIPVSYDLTFALGIERARPTWGASSTWLGTIFIRKKLSFPIPFL